MLESLPLEQANLSIRVKASNEVGENTLMKTVLIMSLLTIENVKVVQLLNKSSFLEVEIGARLYLQVEGLIKI